MRLLLLEKLMLCACRSSSAATAVTATFVLQWRARNPPGDEGEQLLPPPVREGYLYLLSMADYAAGKLWVSLQASLITPPPSGFPALACTDPDPETTT